ncbi:adenylate/guanylate cyclase domain-containing protein [Bradyrhizobium australafricanum]|uniref:adenylate/guanylate cyclase domain-containing protein n=1 Tax=Bradyrhizobium australafricanum TaxID=2821406 RepID=UPI001CE2FC7D|nr:adenylate/guanylate cyclase domain-containing protein [Bradyrhizobium australafricanum]MCA6098924.1 tetratricopeptide repeat protein [Bradyrhizobium australafricanum]
MAQERPARVERRLSAILAADVAGYSRLMHNDEEATHAKLTTLLADGVKPAIADHGGRVVKNTGDGLLAEFPSAVEAVRAAVQFQIRVDELTIADAEDRRIVFRVGINIGDVIVEPDDIFGDGVNIAARLESIAEPGAICISASAYDQVRGKVGVEFADLGEQNLKNIDRPVRAYAVIRNGSDLAIQTERPRHGPPSPARHSMGQIRARLMPVGAALASIAVIAAVAGGLVVWKAVGTNVFEERQKTQREATARPGIIPRLSLVVLPFANLNNDPEQDYFADGVATDLTTDIAQMPGAFVIGRGTAFTYKNKQVDLKKLGNDLGIRWAVQGAVQRAGDQVRLNVSLVDLSTGRDVWSDRFDGDRTNLAALQEQVTARLARSLNVQLVQAESRRSQMDRPTNPDAVDFSMRGWAKLYEPRIRSTNAQAKDLFDSALRLDPDNIDATLGKAWCIAHDVIYGWSISVVEDKKTAIKLIDQVLAKRPATANAHIGKGNILNYGNPEEALPEYEAALEIDPNSPVAYANKGIVLITAGRAREAFSPVQIALRLSPKDPAAGTWRFFLCHAHVHLRQYNEGIEECRRSINLNKLDWFPYADLISAYGATGQLEMAQQMLVELNAIRSDFTVQWFQRIGHARSSNPQFRREYDDIVEGLRKAGVREQ